MILFPKYQIVFVTYVGVVEKQFKWSWQATQVHVATNYRGW